MNVFFWNLARNNNFELVLKSLTEYDVDFAVFAEYTNSHLETISRVSKDKYIFIDGCGGCEKIKAIVKKEYVCSVRREQARYALYELIAKGKKYIVSGVHLQDRRNYQEATRIDIIGRMVNDIINLEASSECKNTIIIGDFNANPFDNELLQYNAFNSVLFKDVILKSETRTFGDRTYRRFYNPILNYISEDTKMYGSYYNTGGESTSVWHCLDQVLFGKQLVEKIVSIEYIKQIGKTKLVARVGPKPSISDHLPLLAKIID